MNHFYHVVLKCESTIVDECDFDSVSSLYTYLVSYLKDNRELHLYIYTRDIITKSDTLYYSGLLKEVFA